MTFLEEIWATICKYYVMYSDFVHSIFPGQLGDLVEGLIDMVVAIAVVKIIWSTTFSNKQV